MEVLVLKVAEEHASASARVTLNADLVHDLKIDGDTAEEFLEDLATIENFDVTHVDWTRYFHSEGELISLLYLPRLIGYKLRLLSSPPLRQLEPLTLRDVFRICGVE